MFFPLTQHGLGVDILGVVDVPAGTELGDVLVGNHNGQTWILREDVLPTSSGYNDVAYSEQQGIHCTFAPGASPKSYTTTDLGANWTAGSAMPNGNGAGICYSPELDLWLVAAAAANNAMLGSNGLDWTAQTHESVGARVCAPIWAGGSIGLFIMCYNQNINPLSDSKVIRSANGEDWTLNEPFGAQNQGMASLCYSPDRDEVLGVCGNKNTPGVYSRLAWKTVNGINWDSFTIVAEDHQWGKVIWSRRLGKYVAVTGWGGDFLSEDDDMSGVSSDGETWQVANGLPFPGHWRCLVETGSCLIALTGSGGTDGEFAAVSLNGLDWISVELPDTRVWSGLAAKANLGYR